MAHIIVEQVFAAPLGDAEYQALSARLRPCLAARDLRWLRSYVSLDRTRMTCELEAPDADTVREACRSAGVAFERVWTALVVTRDDHPEVADQLAALAARR